MPIGTNIKKIREDKNISFDEMIKRLRVFEKYYSLVEKNIKIPNNNILLKISKILDVSINDIKNYDEAKSLSDKKIIDSKNLKYTDSNSKSININPTTIGNITYVPIEKPTIRDVISSKPRLLNRDDLFRFGDTINIVGVNDITPQSVTNLNDSVDTLISDKDVTTNPKLLNYVESYQYKGSLKTVFYTEVNSGFKVDDKVFIVNGFYDSNLLIKDKKYKKGCDGYKVLLVDKCKLVLDIDYTGNLPYKESSTDDFINLYVIKDRKDFEYFNRQITTRDGVFDYKFNYSQNTIVYSDSNYLSMYGWGENTGLFGAPGFFVKNGTQSWSNITTSFIAGSFSIAENLSYNSNRNLKIVNDSFEFSINGKLIEFQKDKAYIWNEETQIWEVNTEYNQALISKSNFRDGIFKGEWNSGIYGQQSYKIEWKGYPAIWNMGTLLNTKWLSGSMKSNYTLPESYIALINDNTIYQKITGLNNNDWGYNYIIDSEIDEIEIESANIENSKLENSLTYSIVENHLIGTQSSFSLKVNNSIIRDSHLIGGYVKSSDIINSISNNTMLENVKSINSSYKNSVIKDSKYISENNIKILGYDELGLNVDRTVSKISHKVYRFYISESDYKKLKIRDKFYIKGLKINEKSKYPLNFFNKRFSLSTWTEYLDFYSLGSVINNYFYKRGVDVAAFLSTPKDNEWLFNTYYDGSNYTTSVIELNQNWSDYYSIDIFFSIRDIESNAISTDVVIGNSEISSHGLSINNNYEYATSTNLKLTDKIRDIVDISEAFIINSDFESGLIETSDWISGNNINANNDVNIAKFTLSGGVYDITPYTASSTLEIRTQTNYLLNKYEDIYFDEGDVIFLNNVTYESNDGTEVKLGDAYKITNNDYRSTGTLVLKEINTDIISNLPDTSGTFSTPNANNRYNYLHKSKIDSSKINSGIFRRSYITNSYIENESYDINDIDFKEIESIKSLVISDSIFKDNGNIFSRATYLYSSFVDGDDEFRKGIVFRSIWNGLTFSNGTFRESNWLNGHFIEGIFYKNKSFDSNPTINYPYYDSNRVKSYYKSGTTSATISNDRFSWKDGNFENGEFYKSDWEGGNFNNGEFIYSNFYDGVINGGLIGDSSIDTKNTKIYNAEINYTTVNNATIYSTDSSLYGLSSSSINWYNGIFNSGFFGASESHSAIWHNGEFNSGEFSELAKWKNGTFSSGKFTSIFGWTMSDSSNVEDYSWEGGIFNNGVFGNGELTSNSTWFNGEFNDGKFIGKVWNNGLFSYGQFIGSSTYSAIGAIGATDSNASLFVDSFSQSYYGIWRNGVVSNKKDIFIKNKKNTTVRKRFNYTISNKKVEIQNILWLGGTFSHKNGKIENSVWLDGTFENGDFINSSFNPFVKRNGDSEPSFNLSDSCYWKNGNSINSDFYISKWENGKFNLGNSYGMIWKDGVSEYMNAYNIFWEKGHWRNGNWFGSNISYDGTISDEFYKQILYRGMQWREDIGIGSSSSCHIWNIFEDKFSSGKIITNSTASTPNSSVN